MSMPTSVSRADTVRKLYDAFQRGDMATILSLVSDNVDWNNSGTTAGALPWNGNFSGKAKLPGFFAALAQHLDITVFELKDFVSEGNHVAVRLHIKYTVKKTGKGVEYESIHFWTFDPAGKVAQYRHFNDTGAESAAFRA